MRAWESRPHLAWAVWKRSKTDKKRNKYGQKAAGRGAPRSAPPSFFLFQPGRVQSGLCKTSKAGPPRTAAGSPSNVPKEAAAVDPRKKSRYFFRSPELRTCFLREETGRDPRSIRCKPENPYGQTGDASAHRAGPFLNWDSSTRFPSWLSTYCPGSPSRPPGATQAGHAEKSLKKSRGSLKSIRDLPSIILKGLTEDSSQQGSPDARRTRFSPEISVQP